MRLYGYGEDVLTLCAITRNFDDVLLALDDHSPPSDCQVFYRPSFGRRGAHYRSELGEFGFLILSHQHLYLGESIWDRAPGEFEDGILRPTAEQTLRHNVFKFYVKHWAFGRYGDWEEFRVSVQPLLDKSLARKETRLASNLKTVLGVISEHFPSQPCIRDVLLLFHHAAVRGRRPERAGGGFELVCVDCSAAMRDNFVSMVM